MHHEKFGKLKKLILIGFPIILMIFVASCLIYLHFDTWTEFSDDNLIRNLNDYETVVKVLQEDYSKNYSSSNKLISYEFRCVNNSKYDIYATNSEYSLQLSDEEKKSFDVARATCKFSFDSTSLMYLQVDENKVMFTTHTRSGALVFSKNGKKPKESELTVFLKDNLLIKKLADNWYFASVRTGFI